ncbi:hypothetical protein SHLO109777_10065 [Shewanella loihica]
MLWVFNPYLGMCGLTAEVSRGTPFHTRARGRSTAIPLLHLPLPPQTKLHALVRSLVLMDKSLSLPKDASLHLRKLAGHPCPPHPIYSNALRQLRGGFTVATTGNDRRLACQLRDVIRANFVWILTSWDSIPHPRKRGSFSNPQIYPYIKASSASLPLVRKHNHQR